MTKDDGILINPTCPGINMQFTLLFYWDGQVRLDIPNVEMTPDTQHFLGNAFHSLSEILLRVPN